MPAGAALVFLPSERSIDAARSAAYPCLMKRAFANFRAVRLHLNATLISPALALPSGKVALLLFRAVYVIAGNCFSV